MKTTKLLLPLGLLLLTVHPAPATPFSASEVSQDAKWHLHADLDSMRSSTMGRLMVSAIEKKHEDKMKAAKRMFSLNPLTDLQAVTLWGPGEKDQGVALIRGTFDRAHLEDLIGAADEHSTSNHQSHTVHTWEDKGTTQHGAFVGNDLAVMGRQKELVTLALDVLDQRAPGMAEPAAQAPSALLLGLADLQGLDLKGDNAKLIEKAISLGGRVFEDAGRLQAQGKVTAANAEDAQRIQSILEGMIAMAELANENLQALDLKSTIKIEGDTTVTATLSIANEPLLELVKEAGDLEAFLRK